MTQVEIYEKTAGFLAPSPSDELFHAAPADADYSFMETSFLGFNIPEAGIDCEIYSWFRPTLGVMSAGIMIWRGYKTTAGQAEYLDYRNVLPYPDGDLDDIQYPTGVKIRIVEPLRHLYVEFESPDGRVRLTMACRAIMPAAGRADGKHFVQAMRCEGTLELDGERFSIDSFTTRDRSYLQNRPEDPLPFPPTTWGAAVFGEDLAFHFVGSESPELSSEQLKWGYVWRDGELRTLQAMRKVTHRADNGLWPLGAEVDLVDGSGDSYRLRGTGISMLPMSFWTNMLTNLMLTRWELDGDRVGYGDYQDILFPQTLRTIGD